MLDTASVTRILSEALARNVVSRSQAPPPPLNQPPMPPFSSENDSESEWILKQPQRDRPSK